MARTNTVAVAMGDCQFSAVARFPAVAHAGGVKMYASILHVFRPMAL